MNYIEALQKRYSVKKFNKEKKISTEVLRNILAAGQLSASSLGLQPYKIFVVESEEIKEKLLALDFIKEELGVSAYSSHVTKKLLKVRA